MTDANVGRLASASAVGLRSLVADEDERSVFRCERPVGACWVGHDILLQKRKVSCDCGRTATSNIVAAAPNTVD